MKAFDYTRAADAADAIKQLANQPDARFLAGGTNLLDLMKDEIENAAALVDLTRAGMTGIRETPAGISLGALAKNSDTADHPVVRKNFPLLSRAILAAATFQIRNMATNGGNMLQRTRCSYFYDTAMPCNKRTPGSGCGALEGLNRTHAIFGASEKCVAVHPSDMAVALAALDATVLVSGPDGDRAIPFEEFHRLPGDHPELDNTLKPGELIVSIDVPANRFSDHYYYLKVRDRASYAFALVSVAVAMEMENGRIKDVRIAMGGVAHKPWRVRAAEDEIRGQAASAELFARAAQTGMAGAKPLQHNAYKIELGHHAIVRALEMAAKTS